jgi:hypothetical protein
LKLVLRYKQARQQAESFKAQLLGMEGIKTPPQLSHGSGATHEQMEAIANTGASHAN